MLLLPHFKSALAFGLILTNRLQGKRHVRLLSEVSRTSWLLLFPPDTPSQTYQEPTSASRNRKAYKERGAQSIPALIAKLMVGTNLDIRPSCHLLSEPKGDQRKSLLKESWRTINHCSNNKLGDGLIHWNWRKTTERDVFSIPRGYICIIPSVRHHWREVF